MSARRAVRPGTRMRRGTDSVALVRAGWLAGIL
jgi:hypothetical protein